MITAQDIRDKGFERARVGGYDMASVDDFLEELADDVAATQKENAVLKSKMKVLVDKVEEYRSNEEALNAAILSAQKLAVQIENEARQRAAATIAEAEEKARETIGSISAPCSTRPPLARSPARWALRSPHRLLRSPLPPPRSKSLRRPMWKKPSAPSRAPLPACRRTTA